MMYTSIAHMGVAVITNSLAFGRCTSSEVLDRKKVSYVVARNWSEGSRYSSSLALKARGPSSSLSISRLAPCGLNLINSSHAEPRIDRDRPYSLEPCLSPEGLILFLFLF